MDRFLERPDLINGRHGRAVAVTADGRREDMFYLKNINVDISVENNAIKRLGTMKNINFQGTPTQEFSATVYRSTRFFRDIMVNFINKGIETRFDLILVQNDPNHAAGEEIIILKNCLVNKAQLLKLDIDQDTAIEEDISGTFEGVEVRA